MRRLAVATRLPYAALARLASTDEQAANLQKKKMSVLHRILKGEQGFRRGELLKACNVELAFGPNWKKELSDYAQELDEAERLILDRQVARLNLTRYTVQELGHFGGNGPAGVDIAAQGYLLREGVEMMQRVGAAEFEKHVCAEGALCNWPEEKITTYIHQVETASAAAAMYRL